jgi:hypothetical protein
MDSNTIVKTAKQKSIYQPYAPGICSAEKCDSTTEKATCNPGDWEFNQHYCGTGCPTQPQCSRIDPFVCPQLVRSSALISSAFSNKPPLVDCVYDVNAFDTPEKIEEYVRVFGKDNDWATKIMPNFCTMQTTTCPIDITTGQPMTSCSNFVSPGQSTQICRSWVNCEPELSDQVKNQYCSENNTADCKCINRNQNSLYNSLNSALSDVPDSCWWAPCADTVPFLVPTDMLNENCPSNTCSQLNTAITNNNLSSSVRGNTEFINCKIDENNLPMPMPTPVVNPRPKGKEDNLIYWVLIGLAILVIILFLIFGFRYYRRRQKEAELKAEIEKGAEELGLLITTNNLIEAAAGETTSAGLNSSGLPSTISPPETNVVESPITTDVQIGNINIRSTF